MGGSEVALCVVALLMNTVTANRGSERVTVDSPNTFALAPESFAFSEAEDAFFVSSRLQGFITKVMWNGEETQVTTPDLVQNSQGLIVAGPYDDGLIFTAPDVQRTDVFRNTSANLTGMKIQGPLGSVFIVALDGTVKQRVELTEQLDAPDVTHNLKYPNDVAADGMGSYFVTDSYQGAVYRVDGTGTISVVIQDARLASAQGPRRGADGIVALQDGSRLVIAVESTLYVLQHAQQTSDWSLTQLTDATNTDISRLNGLTVDRDGFIYAADSGSNQAYQITVDWDSNAFSVVATKAAPTPCDSLTAVRATSYGVYGLCYSGSTSQRSYPIHYLDFGDDVAPAVEATEPNLTEMLSEPASSVVVWLTEAAEVKSGGLSITDGMHTVYVHESDMVVRGRRITISLTDAHYDVIRSSLRLSLVFHPDTLADFHGNTMEVDGEWFYGAIDRVHPNMPDADAVLTDAWMSLSPSTAVRGASFALQATGFRYASNMVGDRRIYFRLSKSEGCSAIPNPEHTEGFTMNDSGAVLFAAVTQAGTYHVCMRHRSNDWNPTGHLLSIVDSQPNELFFGTGTCHGALQKAENADFCGCWYGRGNDAMNLPAMHVGTDFPAWGMTSGTTPKKVVSGCCKVNPDVISEIYQLESNTQWGMCGRN